MEYLPTLLILGIECKLCEDIDDPKSDVLELSLILGAIVDDDVVDE